MRDKEDRPPLRQFRITVTEDAEEGVHQVHLSWRTFPCDAARWDGSMFATVPGSGPLAITSQEALREVLLAVSGQPWKEGFRGTRGRR